MQYWINHNGVQTGPVDVETLKQMGLTSDAYVWCEGMTDWVKISQVPELQGMYETSSRDRQYSSSPSTEELEQPYTVGEAAEPCPPTNMVWAVLATVFCCIPFGIVGIIYANKVSKLYLSGDIEGAQKASETGAWWCIAAITIGIIWRPVMLLTSGG